jgi:F-type H+-transporting ATPase subunit gamma
VAAVHDIKRRIRSVQNTRKITKAFELVAAARLRRAQARIEAMRPYADRMTELMIGTARASTSVRGLPLLQRREIRTAAVLALTGDRGLAGAFNSQILRQVFAIERRLRGEGVQGRWLVSGRKGSSSLRFRRYEVDQAWIGFSDRPGYRDAQAIAHRICELYSEGEVDSVILVYNHFVSPLVQRVVEQEILPIPESLFEAGEDRDQALTGDFIYEPEAEEILERLLPVYVETELFRALLE